MDKTLARALILALAWASLPALSMAVAVEAAHTPEWTDRVQGDPGAADSVAEDLQKVVVLCATQPDSYDFNRAWTDYLKSHQVMEGEIAPLIKDVLDRAGKYQSASGEFNQVPREKTGKHMRQMWEKYRKRRDNH